MSEVSAGRSGACQAADLRLKTVAAVIATRNRDEPLRRCLDSIVVQNRLPDSVIVVDSSDSDKTERLAGEYATRLNIQWFRAPFASAARQRNFGAEHTNCEIVLFLDDDVVLEPRFVDEMMNVFERSPMPVPAGVSGTITNQVYSDPKGLNRLLLGVCMGKLRGSYAGRLVGPAVNFLPEDREDTLQDVDWLPTTCTAYVRDIFLSERFEESFEGYSFAEDVHLSSRIARRHRLVNTSRARVFHEDLGQHTHKDWVGIGRSQVMNRHLVLTTVLNRRRAADMVRLFAFEMIYSPVAYLAAGASKERRRILRQLLVGKWAGFRALWRRPSV